MAYSEVRPHGQGNYMYWMCYAQQKPCQLSSVHATTWPLIILFPSVTDVPVESDKVQDINNQRQPVIEEQPWSQQGRR